MIIFLISSDKPDSIQRFKFTQMILLIFYRLIKIQARIRSFPLTLEFLKVILNENISDFEMKKFLFIVTDIIESIPC